MKLNHELTKKGIGPATRSKHFAALRSCFQAAIEHGHASKNPIDAIPRNQRPRPPKGAQAPRAAFTNAEISKLLREVPEGTWRTLFEVGFHTGLREGSWPG